MANVPAQKLPPPVPASLVVGRVVALLRRQGAYGQGEVASELGVSRSLVAWIETGRVTPDLLQVLAIERLLLGVAVIDHHGDVGRIVAGVMRRLEEHGVSISSADTNRASPYPELPALDAVIGDVLERLYGERPEGT